MKVVFTLIVLLNFCLIAFWGYSANENQNRRAQVPSKIAANAVSKDTLSQNTIHINGGANSAIIYHNVQRGSVNINQSGNENQVNVKQANYRTKAEGNSAFLVSKPLLCTTYRNQF